MTPFFYNEDNLNKDVKTSGINPVDKTPTENGTTAALALTVGGLALLANKSPSPKKGSGTTTSADPTIPDLVEDALDVVRIPAVYPSVNRWHAASIMQPIHKIKSISNLGADNFFSWKGLSTAPDLKAKLRGDTKNNSYSIVLHTGTVGFSAGSAVNVRKLISDDWINGNIGQSSWELVSESGKQIHFLLMGIVFTFLPSLLPDQKHHLRCPVAFKVCGLIDKRMRHSDTSMQPMSSSNASNNLKEIVRVQNGSKSLEYMAYHIADGIAEGPITFGTGDTFPVIQSEKRGVLHTTDIVHTTIYNPIAPLIDQTANGAVSAGDYIRYVEHDMIGYYEGPQSVWDDRVATTDNPTSVAPKRVMTLTGAEVGSNKFNNFGLGVLRRFYNNSSTNNSVQWGNSIPALTTALLGASVPGALDDAGVQKASKLLKGWLKVTSAGLKLTFIPNTGTTREEENASFWQFHLGLGSKETDCTLVRWNKAGTTADVFLGSAKAIVTAVAQTGGGVAYAPLMTLEFKANIIGNGKNLYTLILYPASIKEMIYDHLGTHLDRGYTNKSVTVSGNLMNRLNASNSIAKNLAQGTFVKMFNSSAKIDTYADLK